MGTSDPVFRKRIKEHGYDIENPDHMPKIGELWIDQVWHGQYIFRTACGPIKAPGKAHTWEKIPKWVK